LSTQRDILGTRQTTGQDVTLGPARRHVVSLWDTLNGAQSLGYTLWLVGKLQKQLLTEGRPLQGRTDCALRTGDGPTTTCSVQNKIVEVVSLHELKNRSTMLVLAFTDCLDLGLKGTDFVIGSNPRAERVSDNGGVCAHLRLPVFFFESFLRLLWLLRPFLADLRRFGVW
jgi:hypothetical protein